MGGTYRQPSQPPLPKRSRTLPIYGTGENAGRYYHCWYCGFVCDVRRDALGDSDSEAGDNHTDYNNLVEESNPTNPGGKLVACLGGDIGHFHTAMELGPQTTPELIKNSNFTNWDDNFPVNWTQHGTPDATNYVTRSGNGVRIVRTDNVSGLYQYAAALTNIVNKVMVVSIKIRTVTSGTITIEQGSGNYVSSESGISSTGISTYRHTPTVSDVYIIGATNSTDIIVDSFSVKFATPSSAANVRLPKTIVHNLKSNVTHGCPFCGSTNWRGDY